MRWVLQDLCLWEKLCTLKAQRQSISQGLPEPPHAHVLEDLRRSMVAVAEQQDDIVKKISTTSAEHSKKELERGIVPQRLGHTFV